MKELFDLIEKLANEKDADKRKKLFADIDLKRNQLTEKIRTEAIQEINSKMEKLKQK